MKTSNGLPANHLVPTERRPNVIKAGPSGDLGNVQLGHHRVGDVQDREMPVNGPPVYP